MILVITLIVVLFISYLIYKDPTIVHKSISYSYYEDRETAVVWGSFAGVIGMIILFWFPSPLTLIAGICLTLVPVFGNFQKPPITYIHYCLALAFYTLMLIYTSSFEVVTTYVILSLILLYTRQRTLSLFWTEVIGIGVIIMNLILMNK